MNNSETPTGVNGKQEIKVNKSDDVDKLLDKFFGDLENEGYKHTSINCITFEVPKERIKGELKDEGTKTFEEVISSVDPGRKIYDPLEINAGKVISKVGKETSKNKTAYDKKREEAKKLAEEKRDNASKKIEKEKKKAEGTEKPAMDDR